MRSIKNLLVMQCELDKQAHIGFFDTHEDAVKAARMALDINKNGNARLT